MYIFSCFSYRSTSGICVLTWDFLCFDIKSRIWNSVLCYYNSVLQYAWCFVLWLRATWCYYEREHHILDIKISLKLLNIVYHKCFLVFLLTFLFIEESMGVTAMEDLCYVLWTHTHAPWIRWSTSCYTLCSKYFSLIVSVHNLYIFAPNV